MLGVDQMAEGMPSRCSLWAGDGGPTAELSEWLLWSSVGRNFPKANQYWNYATLRSQQDKRLRRAGGEDSEAWESILSTEAHP